MRTTLFVAVLVLVGCSTGSSVVNLDSSGADQSTADVQSTPDNAGRTGDEVSDSELPPTLDTWSFDVEAKDVATTPQCDPGEGCFLDPCAENADCLSGWCVEHMGDDVCTIACSEECPPGWTCKQVAESGSDLVFACVSDHAALCKPCSNGMDCAGTTGSQGTCVDYGSEGSFCGGGCTEDEDCPWGFSCNETTTVNGIATKQCVADAGVCPCTDKSVAAALFTPCEIDNEFGTCSGKRVCTAEGLSDCDAGEPAVETCNGIDDDCDGEVDEPSLLDGDYVNLCKDDNPCTEDKCMGEAGCDHVALDGVECADGNPCTIADTCDEGVCVGTSVDCDDGNPCTDDTCNEAGGCEYTPNTNDCDDNDPCTVADRCEANVCVGVAVACNCLTDDDCEAIDDDDVCNGTLFCDTAALPFQCAKVADSEVDCPQPAGPNAPCLVALCDPETGDCSFSPANDGAACLDGDACTVGDTCNNGVCVAGPAANCNDGNPCTDDACDADDGCLHTHNQAPCSDDNVCTVDDQCEAGSCVSGDVLTCDDDNPCTADGCDPKTGCVHVVGQGACDDGNACTTGDTCAGGKCIAKGTLSCDDENPCTADSCDVEDGCIHAIAAGSCDDGDPCTTGDTCINGSCQSGLPIECDDNNPCTDDSCQNGKCQFVPNDADCDDGNACTLADTCVDGECTHGSLLACDDDNICTSDTCDPDQGCLHLLNTVPCDDDNVCTLKDTCQLGECIGGGFLTCDDSNPCTDDSCNPESGCQFLANAADCSDGNACTAGDVCQSGWCKAGSATDCDDGDACTDDSCAPETGCQHLVNTDFQSDAKNCGECGNVCAGNQSCQGGKCLLNHGEPCANDEECLSNVCRLDWDGVGTFCAQDTESCVLAFDAPAAAQVVAGGIRCGNGGHKTCADGAWGGLEACLGASCETDVFTPAQSCVDELGCTIQASKDCSPFVCDQTGCKASCASSNDCTGELVCAGGECVDAVINKAGSILAGSEYYDVPLAGYKQCAGWKNTSPWDILTCDWIHSCAATGKTLRFRLHDAAGNVVFDETFPSFTQTEMNNNMAGCDDSGYGTCGKAGPSGKALLIYKPNNGNGGCHGDDNSAGAVRISTSTNGNNMGNNYIFLGGKTCYDNSHRSHNYGNSPDSEIRWRNGSTWDGCSHDDRKLNWAVSVYLSN